MFRIIKYNYKLSYGKLNPVKMKDSAKFLGKWLLYWVWILRIHFGKKVHFASRESITLVLLSYKRIRNIEPIVKSALKCSFISRVIISNNNPVDYKLTDYMKFKDSRVMLIEQSKREGVGNRWEIALSDSNNNFIIIDDDIFIKPGQLRKLFKELIENKRIPHGLAGSINFKKFVDKADRKVEILHQIYAVTRRQIEKYFEYKNLLEQIPSLQDIGTVDIADDIIISNTGDSQAAIHNAGMILRCPSSHDTSIASYLQEDFYLKRRMILDELNEIRAVEKKINELQNIESY
ncbi:MAG: hypothetical protein IPM56_11335 [Ignavibacteriales bacterium]|nr:MAG: hypothetical protein IPM56_11335 [Ignavibacteriales bacterium]